MSDLLRGTRPSRPDPKLTPCEQGGYEVYAPNWFVRYVFPDNGGWKPYSIHGRCMADGHPPFATPIQAATMGGAYAHALAWQSQNAATRRAEREKAA